MPSTTRFHAVMLIAAAVLISCASAGAQPLVDGKRLYEEGVKLDRKGAADHEARLAREKLRQAVFMFEKSGDKGSVAQATERAGDISCRRGDYDDAVACFRKSQALWQELGDRENSARNLKKIGDVRYYQSRYDQAEECYEQTLSLANELKDRKLRGATLTNLGRVYRIWGKREKAAEYHTEALLIAEQTGDAEIEAYACNNLGNVYKDQGKNTEALDYYVRSLMISKKIGDRRGQGLALANLSEVHFRFGKYETAVVCGREALAILRDLGDVRLEGGTLDNLGAVHLAWGQYSEAEQCYLQALSLSRKTHYRSVEATVLERLGNLYTARGEHEKALKCYQESMDIGKETKDPQSQGRCLLDVGKVQAQQGRYAEALKSFSQALQLWQSSNASVEEPHELIGSLYLDRGQTAEAEPHVRKSGRRDLLGRFALLTGQYETATRYYRETLVSAEENHDVNLLFTAYAGLGRAHESQEDYAQAEEFYQKAVNLIEEMRSGLSPAERGDFFNVRINGFLRSEPAQGLTRVRMKTNRASHSIESSEATRARAFSERLRERAGVIFSGVPKAVLEEEDRLTTALTALHKTRAEISREHNPDGYANLTRELAGVEKEFSDFVEKLWKEHREYAAVKYPQPVKLAASALRPDEHVVMFDVSGEGVGVKLIRGKEIIETHYRQWKLSDLEEDVKKFRRSFEAVDLKSFDSNLGKTLYKRLLARVLMDVQAGTPITVIPDGILAILPFEALVVEGRAKWNETGDIPIPEGITFVGDLFPINYYQSITAMTLARNVGERQKQGDKVLVMADPVFEPKDPRTAGSHAVDGETQIASASEQLMTIETEIGLRFPRLPLTGQLAEHLKKLDPTKTDLFSGVKASKALLLQRPLDRYGSMVFATHGYFGKDLPGVMEPVLVLTLVDLPNGSDGFLRMTEVMGLRLNADIVALTACQTGLGKRVSGEGTMNMGRAFQYAGARSVLMSLWSVEQSASVKLIESFFGHIKEGKTKLEALRLARNEVRKQGFDHPFFWAPFILVGEVD